MPSTITPTLSWALWLPISSYFGFFNLNTIFDAPSTWLLIMTSASAVLSHVISCDRTLSLFSESLRLLLVFVQRIWRLNSPELTHVGIRKPWWPFVCCTDGQDFSTQKFPTNGQRQCHNLKMSERKLLYSAIFVACLVKLPNRFVKQYYSSQSEIE